jgi:hypothetical protein
MIVCEFQFKLFLSLPKREKEINGWNGLGLLFDHAYCVLVKVYLIHLKVTPFGG